MNIKEFINNSIYKILITGVLVFFGTIISFKSDSIKAYLYENIYNNTLSFAKVKKLYNKYVGDVIPFENIITTKEVFNEKIKYKSLDTFKDGVSLSLEEDYGIPIIKTGIVIYIGSKEELNKTVIIEDEDGLDYIYGNLDKVNVKIYDYVKENDLLGKAKNNKLYLLFKKGEDYLDYKEFLE